MKNGTLLIPLSQVLVMEQFRLWDAVRNNVISTEVKEIELSIQDIKRRMIEDQKMTFSDI